ncbi:MAG: hypothetical protein A2992_02425 [Elusimicrobia bacterium RIFCSPLOWO2_01_FULL_59_12]|nr:MAG: hypothetical protein A2992_02425 [Elusimicrobia bacterium RIFCSPLOWO2_01_FULL_59_12]
MKWLYVFAGALLFWSGSLLWAEGLAPAEHLSDVGESSATALAEPFSRPVSAKIGGRPTKIISEFGVRKAPDTLQDELHEGVDFVVPPEAQVRAARSGKVLFAGYSGAYVSRADKKDKNHLVIILHEDGKSTRYVHLERLRVRPGLIVKAGDVIGTTSESDEWTVPVLHFEIREANGQALDPMDFLLEPQKAVP